MAQKSGIKSKREREKEQREREEKAVSCIVNFRPCEGWRGEYGFDYVREEEDPYEEKLFCQRSKRVEVNGENKRVIEVNEAQMDHILRRKMGKRGKNNYKYDDWVAKQRKMLLAKKKKGNPEMDVEAELFKLKQQEYYKMSQEEVQEYWDAEFWQTAESGLNGNADEGEWDVVCPDCPIEYLYHPKYVNKVSYFTDKEKEGKVWWSKVEYADMANGYEEAQDHCSMLDCYVHVGTKLESLGYETVVDFDDNILPSNGYFITLYSDRDRSGRVKTFNNLTEQNYTVGTFDFADKFVQQEYTFSELVVGALQGKFDDYTNVLFHDAWAFFSDVNPMKALLCRKEVDFEKEGVQFHLAYVTVNRTLYFYAELSEKRGDANLVKKMLFKNGSLQSVFYRGQWITMGELNDAAAQSSFQSYAAKIDGQFLNDVNVEIQYLIENESYKNLSVVLHHPNYLKNHQLPTVEKENGVYWEGHKIGTWMERYEDTFSPVHYYMKGEEEERKYCVPILSVALVDGERTKFKFKTQFDAPVKIPEVKNQYKLQFFVEGECQKLVLRTNNPNGIKITPEEFTNPNQSEEFTVELIGNQACAPSIIAYSIENEGKRNEKQTEVGRMQIDVRLAQEIKVSYIKVKVKNETFSSRFLNSLADQKKAMNNALLQAGITPQIDDSYTITLSKEQAKKCRKGKIWNLDSKEAYKLIIDTFLKAYPVDFDAHYSYLFFFFDGEFDDNTLAFSTQYEDFEFIMSSNGIGYNRYDVYTMAHEILHNLHNPHIFQKESHKYLFPFCFPLSVTSNVMDYFTLAYSLHKYQWDVVSTALMIHNEEAAQKAWKEEVAWMMKCRDERNKRMAEKAKKTKKKPKIKF